MSLPITAASTLEKITAYKNSGITFKIDGKPWTPKYAQGNPLAAIFYNGSTYVPLRAGFETAGFEVKWVDATQEVLMTSPKKDGSPSGNTGGNTGGTTNPGSGTSTEKAKLTLQSIADLHNKFMSDSGLASAYSMSADQTKFDNTTGLYSHYLFYLSNPENPGTDKATYSIEFETKTGEFSSIKMAVSGALIKPTILNLISTVLQDAKAGKEVYDANRYDSLIDNAIKTGSQGTVTAQSGEFNLSYMYVSASQTHVFTIFK